MDELTARIGKGLGQRLDGFKFVKSRRQLVRKSEDGWQAIVIDVLPTADPCKRKLAAHAQVRIDRIEETYSPFHPFLKEVEAKTHATITTNCDRLLAETPVIHGFAIDDHSVDSFIIEYANALKTYVMPWLHQYSTEEAIFNGLIDDDPMKWITSDRLTRYPVVLAILANRGEWDEFDRISQEFLTYCESPHAQMYKPLAESLAAGLRVAS